MRLSDVCITTRLTKHVEVLPHTTLSSVCVCVFVSCHTVEIDVQRVAPVLLCSVCCSCQS